MVCDYYRLRGRVCGWDLSTLATYRDAYRRFGGGVNTHPDVLAFIMQMTGLTLTFWEYRERGVVLGACFTQGPAQGGVNVWRDWPVTYDELLFPLLPGRRFFLPMYTNRLAAEHGSQVRNATYRFWRKTRVCRVKAASTAKTEKTRRNELNRFLRSGGEVKTVQEVSAQALAHIYTTLFQRRFGGAVRGYSPGRMALIMLALKPMLFGHVLYLQGAPCAYDLVFMAESPQWVYFDVPNGGVDPACQSLSVGSVLMYLNIRAARELCHSKGKLMKFSLGQHDENWGYKLRWADKSPVGKILF